MLAGTARTGLMLTAGDRIRYFTTTTPSSGIFVPLGRASKRQSTDSTRTPSLPSSPVTGLVPPALTPGKLRSESPSRIGARTPAGGRPSLPRPGGDRPESPVRRAAPGPPGQRPTLLPPTTPRTVSAAGGRFGAFSPTPGKMPVMRPRAPSTSSTTAPGQRSPSRSTQRYAAMPKPGSAIGMKQPKFGAGARSSSSMGSRTTSALGQHPEEEPPPPLPSQTTSQQNDEPSTPQAEPGEGPMPAAGESHTVNALKAELATKEMQLREQAASLAEMESSLTELQGLVASASSSGFSPDDASPDVAQLRALLREKNEKIASLSVEFDSHRADFRSTIDTLELASTETERVYEKRVDDLLAEIHELQERTEDVESVAMQLKQLEELVSELEEGLEDARRGEAEARGEVEFLRGEVERSREELRREREKSAAAVANAAVGKLHRNGVTEEKDDEIRGLKAIIHSLSVGGASNNINGNGEARSPQEEALQKQVADLSQLISSKASREEELEREIEALRRRRDARAGSHSSDTATQPWRTRGRHSSRGSFSQHNPSGSFSSHRKVSTDTNFSGTGSQGVPATAPTSAPTAPLSPAGVALTTPATSSGPAPLDGLGITTSPPPDPHDLLHTPIATSSDDDSGDDSGDDSASNAAPWCEICETAGHDILTCTNMFGSGAGGPASAGPAGESTSAAAAAAEAEEALSVSPSEEAAERERERERKKKSVHLPAPPPMVDGNAFGPMPGKESGIIEMDKWCALCERDGHESFDCPIEDL